MSANNEQPEITTNDYAVFSKHRDEWDQLSPWVELDRAQLIKEIWIDDHGKEIFILKRM